MRILYLDFNIQYHNVTRDYIPSWLRLDNDVVLYGPGYVDEETLKEGLLSFYEKSAPFDFVISNEHIVFKQLGQNSTEAMIKAYKSKYFFQFDPQQLLYVYEMLDFFRSVEANKIIILFESDFYHFSREKIARLKELDCYLMTRGAEFSASIKELPLLSKEGFHKLANDNWYSFINEYHDKVISMPHFVSEREFNYESLSNRKTVVALPGVSYFRRRRVADLIGKSMYKTKLKWHNKLFSLFSRLGFNIYSNYLMMKIYNTIFVQNLITTKYHYTDGSALNYPIRKFFEIPASGAVLLASACNGFEDMGYKDMENCLYIEPDEIIEKLDFLENNPGVAQTIALKGQELMWDSHSTQARSRQLAEALLHIKNGAFKGSRWNAGKYEFL